MAKKILCPQPILEEGRQYLLERGYELVEGCGVEEDAIIENIKGCDAMIVRTAKITRKIIEAADQLKVMARHGAVFDGVDLEAAKEKNIMVLYAPRANSQSVAELALIEALRERKIAGRQLGLADTIGSLTVGHAADIAVFKPVQSENVFGDRPSGAANQLLSVGHTIYKPMLTVKNGEMVYRDMLF